MQNYTSIYGFEDYRLVKLMSDVIDPSNDYWNSVRWWYGNTTLLINKNLPLKFDAYRYHFDPKTYPELLDTANRVYIHPKCRISRAVVVTKYNKCLNPWLADAVIIPDLSQMVLSGDTFAMFINEEHKVIIIIDVDTPSTKKIVESLQPGTKLKDTIAKDISQWSFEDNSSYGKDYPTFYAQDALNSEYIGTEECIYVPSDIRAVALDILTYNLPADKLVTETMLQKALSTEENQLSFDTLVSIYDMLNSTDTDSQQAALKSLATMDYMQYPNSVKLVFNEACGYWFNNSANRALHSTAVKFMLDQLYPHIHYKRGIRRRDLNANINEKDFELYKQLRAYICREDEAAVRKSLMYVPFMKVDEDGRLVPIMDS